MNEDFVPYETVLKLEKKGYKGKTIRYHGHIYDVLKWLREEKDIFVQIMFADKSSYYYEVIDIATEQRLQICRDASKIYSKQSGFIGLCYCFYLATIKMLRDRSITEPFDLKDIIPELNPNFFKITKIDWSGYWWDISDVSSRLDALEKITNLYKRKLIQEKEVKSKRRILSKYLSFLTKWFKK